MKKKAAKKQRKRVQRLIDAWTGPLGLDSWRFTVAYFGNDEEYQQEIDKYTASLQKILEKTHGTLDKTVIDDEVNKHISDFHENIDFLMDNVDLIDDDLDGLEVDDIDA